VLALVLTLRGTHCGRDRVGVRDRCTGACSSRGGGRSGVSKAPLVLFFRRGRGERHVRDSCLRTRRILSTLWSLLLLLERLRGLTERAVRSVVLQRPTFIHSPMKASLRWGGSGLGGLSSLECWFLTSRGRRKVRGLEWTLTLCGDEGKSAINDAVVQKKRSACYLLWVRLR